MLNMERKERKEKFSVRLQLVEWTSILTGRGMEKSWIQTRDVSNVFNILHRVKTSPQIFASCRDCPSHLAFAKTVCYLLLPAKTTFHEKWLPAETVCHIWLLLRLSVISCFLPRLPSTKNGFLQRLSVIFGFCWDCLWSLASCRDYLPRKMASCRDCLCDSASCRDSQQEAKSHGQSLQEAILPSTTVSAGSKRSGKSQRKPNMTDSLCGKRKWADSCIPCVLSKIAADQTRVR